MAGSEAGAGTKAIATEDARYPDSLGDGFFTGADTRDALTSDGSARERQIDRAADGKAEDLASAVLLQALHEKAAHRIMRRLSSRPPQPQRRFQPAARRCAPFSRDIAASASPASRIK
ncbi:MAG: hypothetical protein PVS3B2_10960 [Candidatus Dormibacteraceae bacterium]